MTVRQLLGTYLVCMLALHAVRKQRQIAAMKREYVALQLYLDMARWFLEVAEDYPEKQFWESCLPIFVEVDKKAALDIRRKLPLLSNHVIEILALM